MVINAIDHANDGHRVDLCFIPYWILDGCRDLIRSHTTC